MMEDSTEMPASNPLMGLRGGKDELIEMIMGELGAKFGMDPVEALMMLIDLMTRGEWTNVGQLGASSSRGLENMGYPEQRKF